MSDHKYKQGDEVRILEGDGKGNIAYIGDDINTPGYEERDEYWTQAFPKLTDALNGFGGRSYEIENEKHVELVRKAEDIPQPKLPTAAELMGYLSMALLDDYDGISVNGTDRDGATELDFYGTSASGQPFSAHIKLTSIDWADE